MAITVILADDHKIVREGIRILLQKYPEIEVIGETEDGRSTVEMARELSPDVVVMDIAMPDMNGIEATRRITEERPGVKVVALSMHSDKRFVSEMLKAGASAYLLKHSAFEELVTAVMTVVENRMYLSPAVTGVVVDNYIKQKDKPEGSVFSMLSDREREVLQLLAEGKNTKEIATILNLSGKTVDAHRMNIMSKLNLHSIAELTKYAIREGLTSL